MLKYILLLPFFIFSSCALFPGGMHSGIYTNTIGIYNATDKKITYKTALGGISSKIYSLNSKQDGLVNSFHTKQIHKEFQGGFNHMEINLPSCQISLNETQIKENFIRQNPSNDAIASIWVLTVNQTFIKKLGCE